MEPRVSAVLDGVTGQLLALSSLRSCLAAAGPRLSRALGELCHYELLRGDVGTAVRVGRRGVEVAEELAKADPHSAQAKRDLSVSFERLGEVEVSAGNFSAARDLFSRSLSLREELAKADPHEPV